MTSGNYINFNVLYLSIDRVCWIYILYRSTNRNHFLCFHTVIETRVESRKPAGRVFSRYFEFSQTFTSVSITYGTRKQKVFYFFYKLTRRKLKRGNCILFFLLKCVVSTSVSTKMFPVSYVLNKNHDKKDNNLCPSVYKLYNCRVEDWNVRRRWYLWVMLSITYSTQAIYKNKTVLVLGTGIIDLSTLQNVSLFENILFCKFVWRKETKTSFGQRPKRLQVELYHDWFGFISVFSSGMYLLYWLPSRFKQATRVNIHLWTSPWPIMI